MPELPDLQVFSKNLNKQLTGKKLKKTEVTKGAKLNVTPGVLAEKFENHKLIEVYRDGKELRFLFDNKKVLGLHMMLRGKLIWFDDEPPKHTLLQLKFEKGKNLALTDFQRSARIIVNPEPSEAPDVLSPDVNLAFWKKALQSKATIKNLLLDQHITRGIGNAYADEILWEAGISPVSVSNKIPPEKIKALVKAIKHVLSNAEKQITKAAPGIIGGEIRDFLNIHNADKKTSPSGSPIKNISTGGRKTYFTDEQKEY